MFGKDSPKHQPVPAPESAGEGVIVSPDTRRAERIPPGQSRTIKWPVLDASGPPRLDMAKWKFSLAGLVATPVSWSWEEFQKLPRVKVFSDFHCVTRWSLLGSIWEGVSTRELVARAGGLLPNTHFVLAYGYDHGWTTNLPLEHFMAEDAMVAFTHNGEPLSLGHGGPARLLVPQLYAWKSAKWAAGVEFRETDQAGFWERNGYHMRGDPWEEERFGF
ncbi:MAG TPA: sulfite oxidase-like oxidoreductase [Bryobacteraceae bacterium]|nr:sulfite oxidase-like oxidoreductase [Bryobacteraceae bacterium]